MRHRLKKHLILTHKQMLTSEHVEDLIDNACDEFIEEQNKYVKSV